MAPRVFISAATVDYEKVRKTLEDELSKISSYDIVIQEKLGVGLGTLEKLSNLIKDCAAVIHIIGPSLGEYPDKVLVQEFLENIAFQDRYDEILSEKSIYKFTYTQWEAWLAHFHKKKLFIFMQTGKKAETSKARLSAAKHLALLRKCVGSAVHPIEFKKAGELYKLITQALGTSNLEVSGAKGLTSPSAKYVKSIEVLPELKPDQAIPDKKEVLGGFVRRDWLDQDVAKWMEDRQSQKIYWIREETGFGKSAFAADMVRRNGELQPLLQRSRVIASYFCSPASNSVHALRLLYQQLKASHELFGNISDALTYTAERKGIECDNDLEEPSKFAAFGRELLIKPLEDSGNELLGLVVIDGVDEAIRHQRDGEGETWTNQLADLFELLRNIPTLRFVVTSRREHFEEIRNLFVGGGHRCAPDSTDYAEIDCDKYIDTFPESWRTPSLRKALHKRSQRSFLYLGLLRKHIETQGLTSIVTKSDIPPSLGELYDEQMQTYFAKSDGPKYERDVLPWLQMMAAGEHGDLRVADMDLCVLANRPDATTREISTLRNSVQRALHGYFDFDGEYPLPFHLSVMDWLLRRRPFHSRKYEHVFQVEIKKGHELLGEWAWQEKARGAAKAGEDLSKRYWCKKGALHLAEAGRLSNAVEFLRWLKEQRRDEGKPLSGPEMAENLAAIVRALQSDKSSGQSDVNMEHLFELFAATYATDDLEQVIGWIGGHIADSDWPGLVEAMLAKQDYVVRYAAAAGQARRFKRLRKRKKLPKARREISELLSSQDANRQELGCYTVVTLGKVGGNEDPDGFDPAWLDKMMEIPFYFSRSALGDLLIAWSLSGGKKANPSPVERFVSKHREFQNVVWDHLKLDNCVIAALHPGSIDQQIIVNREIRQTVMEDRALFTTARAGRDNLETALAEFPHLCKLVKVYLHEDSATEDPNLEKEFEGLFQPDSDDLRTAALNLMVFLMSHPAWSNAEWASGILQHLSELPRCLPNVIWVLDELLKHDNWRIRYGALDATYLIRHRDPLYPLNAPDMESRNKPIRFDVHLAKSFGDGNCRIRGLCAENFVADLFERDASQWIIRLEERIFAPDVFQCEIAVARWLRDNDCWVLEHVYRLFHTIHQKLSEAAQPLDELRSWRDNLLDGLSRSSEPCLLMQISDWYQMSRDEFLRKIETAKREDLGR